MIRRVAWRHVPLVLGLTLGLAACGNDSGSVSGSSGPPPPMVEVVRLVPRTLVEEAELLGTLVARESVVVHAEVPGVIETVEFEQGERVEKDQILFRLKDGEQLARLHEARAELRLAEDTHRRTLDLAKRAVVADAQLERAAATAEVARARLEGTQVELDRTRIRAPFGGLAGARLVSPGARVEPDTDLVQVEAIDELDLVFTLPEFALPLARVGVPLELRVAPYPGERFPGLVYFVAPSLNAQNRRLLVKARVPNSDLRLRPGLFAEVHARLGERENALLVPEGAIVYRGEGSFVWRLDDESVAERVSVKLGLRQGGQVEIRSGLAAGNVVVVAGTNKLAPGMRVEGVPTPEEPTSPPAQAQPPALGGADAEADGRAG